MISDAKKIWIQIKLIDLVDFLLRLGYFFLHRLPFINCTREPQAAGFKMNGPGWSCRAQPFISGPPPKHVFLFPSVNRARDHKKQEKIKPLQLYR